MVRCKKWIKDNEINLDSGLCPVCDTLDIFGEVFKILIPSFIIGALIIIGLAALIGG